MSIATGQAIEPAPYLVAAEPLLDALGIEGVAVLLALASLWLLKYESIRAAAARALNKAARAVIRYLVTKAWAVRLEVPVRLAYRLHPERWRAMCEARSLTGLKRGRVSRTPEGVCVRVTLGRSLTIDRLRSSIHSLETGLGVGRGSICVGESEAGAHKAVVWIAVRSLPAQSVPVPSGANAEESALLDRLSSAYWAEAAPVRGLEGTMTESAALTDAGIVCQVRLDFRWTPKHFRDKADEIRALLGARTDLRMEIKSGSHGDRAVIALRTRSAADGVEMTGWYPGAPWGMNTVTGEPVMVPLGRRMLVAGTSGSGKSWSTRALLAEASESADRRLVVIDPKRVEAINWEHRARTAVHIEDVLDVTDELVAEMHERLALIPRGHDVIEVSSSRPRITVFVDEGAEVISMAATKRQRSTAKEPGDPDWSRIMENLRTLARMARAAEIILIWATQKPTMDKNGGIDPQISAQITYRAALALSTSAESRVVFGEDATERGWHAHDLPMPGVAMLRSSPKAKPHPIRTRAFSPADVIALADRPVWGRAASTAPPRLELVKEQPKSALEAVEKALTDGPMTAKELVDATGRSKTQVYAALQDLGAVKEGTYYTLGGAA